MSDYLSTIVARNTGHRGSSAVRDEAGTIRPRLPSLFEPLAAAQRPPIDEIEISATIPATTASSDRRQRRARRPVPSPLTDLSPNAQITPDAAAEQRHDLAPSIAVTASQVQIDERSEPLDRDDRRDGSIASPVESGRSVEARAPQDRSPEVSARARGEHHYALEAETFEPVPLFARQTTPAPAVVTATRSEPPASNRANVRARPVVPSAHESSEPDTADLPAIHVTIGRVEIRAAVAPAVQHKRPAAKPGLSLDEYLGKPARGDR